MQGVQRPPSAGHPAGAGADGLVGQPVVEQHPGGRVELPGPKLVEEAVDDHRLLTSAVGGGHTSGVGPGGQPARGLLRTCRLAEPGGRVGQFLRQRLQQPPDSGLDVLVGQQALGPFGRAGVVAQYGQGVGQGRMLAPDHGVDSASGRRGRCSPGRAARTGAAPAGATQPSETGGWTETVAPR